MVHDELAVRYANVALAVLCAIANLIVLSVIRTATTSSSSNSAAHMHSIFVLMRCLAISELCCSIKATLDYLLSAVCCVYFPRLDAIVFSPSSHDGSLFCAVWGFSQTLGLVAIYGYVAVAINRFAAVFLWRHYKRLFTRRTSVVLFVVVAVIIPVLTYWLPTTAGLNGKFVSYPGYCYCTIRAATHRPFWSALGYFLTLTGYGLPVVIYLVIVVRLCVQQLQLAINRKSAVVVPAVTTAAGVNVSTPFANLSIRRARNSTVFFVTSLVFVALAFVNVGSAQRSWNIDINGMWPLWGLFFTQTKNGIALVS